MLITFEGIEGSGKTTQINLLHEYLTDKGYKVIKTREPGGTPFGESLRQIFLHERTHVNPLSEMLLFMAMRTQHIEEVIIPALKEGRIVLCDRFTDATYAYQGYGRGIDIEIIENLDRLVTKGLMPDLTVYLRCDVADGIKRKADSTPEMDRFETEDVSFHERVKAAYDQISAREPERFFIIDGSDNIQNIHRIIREKVEILLKKHGV